MTPPSIRYFILCEEIQHDPFNSNRLTIIGLVSTIQVHDGGFPARFPELCVFLQLADCRGVGVVQIRVTDADTDHVLFESPQKSLHFGIDPLHAHGIIYRIQNLTFRHPGLYAVEFLYNEIMIDQHPFWVK